jgi:RNA polymerase sigma-70 factor (ECF subfamily)
MNDEVQGPQPGGEAELLDRARRGDDAAFVALCNRYRGQVWRIVASVARSADAEDLAQEAIIRAYRALRGYRGNAAFGAWLCRIAINAAHDYTRSAWKRRVLLFDVLPDERESDDRDSPHSTYERQELQRRVRKAVAGLPESQRVPIWLHYFEGYAAVEVARLEGVPEATVRSRIRAGLRRLSLSLGDLPAASAEPCGRLTALQKGCGV